MKIQSAVGLIPLLAVEVLDPDRAETIAGLHRRMEWYLKHRPNSPCLISDWKVCGTEDRKLLSLLRGHRMKGAAAADARRDAVSFRPGRALAFKISRAASLSL
jgi:hypothetical protein